MASGGRVNRVAAGADGHSPDDRGAGRGPEPAVDAGVPAAALAGGRGRRPRLERARRGAAADVVHARRQRLRGARRPGRHHPAAPHVRLLLPVVPLPPDVWLQLDEQEAGPGLHERRKGQGVAAPPCSGDQTRSDLVPFDRSIHDVDVRGVFVAATADIY